MYRLIWCDRAGIGRWRACADAAAVREAAARIMEEGPAVCEVRLDADGDPAWTATSSARALAAWDGEGRPIPLLATRAQVDRVMADAAGAFLGRIRAAAMSARRDGLLDQRQTDALARIAELAIAGEGPAGRGVDPEAVRPAALRMEYEE